MKLFRKRAIWLVVAAATIVAGGAGVGYAATAPTADPGSTVTGCVANTTGALRIVNSPDECRVNEHPITLAGPQVPQIVAVDCTMGQSINAALAAAPINLPLTISITGTCTESVQINRDNVYLRGTSPGSGVTAPDPGAPALDIGGRYVSLRNLSIAGGQGIQVSNEAAVDAVDVTVKDAAQNGITVGNSSHAELNSVSIDHSLGNGIFVLNGGSVSLYSVTVSNSGASAVLADGGHVKMNDTTVTGSVDAAGVNLTNGSSATINASIIENSASYGLSAESSTATVNSGTIQDNGQFGVSAAHGGSIQLTQVRITSNAGGAFAGNGGSLLFLNGVEVDHNTGDGVALTGGSSADFEGGASVHDNSGDGISISDVSNAQFQSNTGLTSITNNGMWGVLCQSAPAVALITGEPSTVTGNGDGQLDCPTV